MSRKTSPTSRPAIQKIEGYVPGEQPQESGWIKLNTNENPYPPSPKVVAAIQQAAAGRLNIYPDPLAKRFCQVAADLYGVESDCILPGNGSDEILTILMRTFVDSGEQIAFPYPSYILYETLAAIQGAKSVRLHLEPDWSWNDATLNETVANSRLVFVPNPNSPSGTLWDDKELLRLIPPHGPLVLDEAYGEFRDEANHLDVLKGDQGSSIVVTRTLSKSYSLAGIRFGFAIADPAVVAEMRKVKDSYNCNTLSLAAATAALEDQHFMQENCAKIRATRTRLAEALSSMGFVVSPSQANFVWVEHSSGEHRAIYEELKRRKILVRYMSFPDCVGSAGGEPAVTRDGIRITIGTDEEIDRFLVELEATLSMLP
ncbi:MAG: histidinol-phosphate transaminase [Planctomycetaceae bacterium]